MNEQEYQKAIPHFCKYRTTKAHAECLMLCWSITHELIQKANRGIEGPQFCHNCELSIRAKRWDKAWYKKVFKE